MVGRPAPPIYSAEISLYVLQAGVALLRNQAADFLYLSTTDYMQHAYGPTCPEALAFYHQIDQELGHLLELGAIVALTADHGMNAKQKANGEPNVIYLETRLEAQFGPGFRVILPITDPYVVHHGALGSFATVYLPSDVDVLAAREKVASIRGVESAMTRAEAASTFELPEDRNTWRELNTEIDASPAATVTIPSSKAVLRAPSLIFIPPHWTQDETKSCIAFRHLHYPQGM